MNEVALRVEGLGKKYRIGAQRKGYKTLRDTLTDGLLAPWRKGQALFQRNGSQAALPEPFWALNQVSFEVKPGEVIGIIGRNGAGKSTLLKVLARITQPTTGRVEIHGRVGSLLEVGTGFHPELTGRENVYLNGAILGMRRSEIGRKFDEIVAFAEVEKFLDTPVKHFSSGMYLRLAFAVAAHLEPEILLVDEVLAVGDVAFQKKCLGKMGEVAKVGRTVLLVSHNLAAVASLCTRTALLHNGRLAYFGATEQALETYAAQDKAPAEIGLQKRTDREGNGAARIIALSVLNAGGEPREVVHAGGEVVFALHYAAIENKPVKNALFELKFTDQFGTLFFTLSTFLTGKNFDTLQQSGIVYCRVPAFPLTPGTYQTQVIMFINNDLCDSVTEALELSVSEGDFYGSGKLPKSKIHGSFLVAQQWQSSPPWAQQPELKIGKTDERASDDC